MKNGKTKLNKTKILARVMLLVLLLSSVLNLAGCSNDWLEINNNEGIEWGLKSSGLRREEVNLVSVAYNSDKKEFDVNDVTLTFFYGVGIDLSVEHMREGCMNYPVFELYFCNDENTHILVKHVEENLVSEKYRVVYSRERWWSRSVKVFNHSEELTIPQGLFSKDFGSICFYISAINIVEEYEKEPRPIAAAAVYYKKIDNKIILSTKEFD